MGIVFSDLTLSMQSPISSFVCCHSNFKEVSEYKMQVLSTF